MNARSEPMTIYILGEEGNLGTTTSAPRWFEPSQGGNVRGYPCAIWLASATSRRWQFPIKRGVVDEYRTLYENRRVFARVLPDDVRPTLEAIDARIAEHEAELKRAKDERRELLDAVVSRAARVKMVKP